MKKKHCVLKLFWISTILFVFFMQPVLADDIDTEEELGNVTDILETSATFDEKTSINSRAYVVLDRNSNTILMEKNATQKRKMASTTKIMTATVIIENCDLSETITISKKAANTGGSRLGLKTGDKITVRDLLYGLMLRSGNDAAVALAEHAGGDVPGFALLMNEKAAQLGLTNTHFETPHGLDSEQHYTTAYELALLSNYAMRNKTFATIVNTKMCTITINGYPKAISNTNELLGNLNGVYGIKTGFTNGANRCLVSCCKRGNLDVICVVLGADTKKFRTSDSIKLLEYTFQNFELTNIEQQAREEFANWKAAHENCFFVEKGVSNVVSFALSKFETSVIPLHKNKKDSLDVEICCDMDFVAPVETNSNIGELTLKVDGQTLATVPIVTTEDIPKKSMWDYFFLFFKNFVSYVQI